MQMFKQGLKSKVRTKLIRLGALTNDLSSLIKEAICIDNNLYELRLETRGLETLVKF